MLGLVAAAWRVAEHWGRFLKPIASSHDSNQIVRDSWRLLPAEGQEENGGHTHTSTNMTGPESVQNTEVEGDRSQPVTENDIGLRKKTTWMNSYDRKRKEEPDW